MTYAIKYGQWYDESKAYFEQFINLRQGKLTVVEYGDEFSRLQELCWLDEDDEQYAISFLRGLRPSIQKNMKDYKDMYETF